MLNKKQKIRHVEKYLHQEKWTKILHRGHEITINLVVEWETSNRNK